MRHTKHMGGTTLRVACAAVSVAALCGIVGPMPLVGQSGEERQSRIDRGEYLVHHVAMCVQCHSPRDERGELDRSRLLQGGRIPVESPYPNQQWCFRAPPLAGLPGGWSEEDLVVFLQTGEPPVSQPPRPPMPPFRMTREDAEAVAAYLRSLR